MTPYQKRGHSRTYWLTVVGKSGKTYRVPTGTHALATAEDMELMLRTLGRRGSRHWDLIGALVEPDPARPGRKRLALARLYDAWCEEQRAPSEARPAGEPGPLDRLRAELADVDLAPAIDTWCATLVTTYAAVTARHYRQRVNVLAPAGEDGTRSALWRSALTPAWLSAKRDALPGGIPARLAYLTAWSAWARWCVGRGLLRENPLEQVEWPREAGRGKTVRHIARLADVQRFVASFGTVQDRAIAALRESTGADWDALEPMRREHIVDAARRLVFLPGDKTGNRPREVEVEPWAWPYVAAYLAETTGLPGAPLFTIKYGTYWEHHVETRDALVAAGAGIPAGYTPHNARHSFAVRKRRAGWPDWKIAAYLGNTAREVAKTYGAFQPTRDDLRQDRAGGSE
jgi:site-specific recombinase XerC